MARQIRCRDPGRVIAGTHSGVGKITITLGLMAAQRRRGLKVQPFRSVRIHRPSHYTAICGRPSINLYLFMMGEDGVRCSFSSAIKGADVAVVEGVMGLYDGMDGTDVAAPPRWPGSWTSQHFWSLTYMACRAAPLPWRWALPGLTPRCEWSEQILNRVGSARHLAMLKSCLKKPVFGALPRDKEMEMKSRHLGLVMGFEKNHDSDSLASFLEENASIDEILLLRAESPPASEETARREKSVRIGIAEDEAFCFYYYENLRELERAGAELVSFSPLRDELPDVDGLYIGGGYPELYASRLEAAPALRQIKSASEDGMPIYGECGGLMYLGQGIESESGSYKMVGALPCTTIMEKRLVALGYVNADVTGENPVAKIGQNIRGHEFHYSRCVCDRDASFAYRLSRGKGIVGGRDGLVEHNTLAGYLHAHFYSFSTDRFIESCKLYRRS